MGDTCIFVKSLMLENGKSTCSAFVAHCKFCFVDVQGERNVKMVEITS